MFLYYVLYIILLLAADGVNFFSRIGIPVENFNNMLVDAVINIIASVIAGALTLCGVYLTIEDNKKEKAIENKRLVMPMLKISASEYDYRHQYIQFDFIFTDESVLRERKNISDTATVTIEIKNVGQRELYDLHLGDFESLVFDEGSRSYAMCPVIYARDSININFMLYEKGSYDLDLTENKFDTLISPLSFHVYLKIAWGHATNKDLL